VADPPQKARWQELVSYWAEIIHKLALPIGTVLATIVGTWLTMRISEENNLRDTINQREQAESSLRSSMFKELVAPILTPTGASDAGAAADASLPERLALLAQLLALNFHEHFELGPLLLYVDNLPNQSAENRRRLRSVARRVISRQLAVLGEPSTEDKLANCKASSEDTEIWLRSDASEPDEGVLACTNPVTDGRSVTLECGAPAATPQPTPNVFSIRSPDCRDRFIVALSELNWTQQTVRVFLSAEARAEARQAAAIPDSSSSPCRRTRCRTRITRSYARRNRVGLYIRQVEADREPCTPPICDPTTRLMRISLVWFPDDFIPPRERPTDFRKVRKALKL
jgi:hypothetical protein